MSSSLFIPGDVRPTTAPRESQAKPADVSAAAHANGAAPITSKGAKPVTKAHKAYKTEQKRDKDDDSQAKDLIPEDKITAGAQQTVEEVLKMMSTAGIPHVAVLDDAGLLKGVFSRAAFFEEAFNEGWEKSQLLQQPVENYVVPVRTSVTADADVVAIVRQFVNTPDPWLAVYELERSLFIGLLTHKDLLVHLAKQRRLEVWI